MTTPKVSTVSRGGDRFYVSPFADDVYYPGVTSVIGMLAKPFLQRWSANMAADFAIDNFASVAGLILNDQKKAAKDLMAGAAYRFTKDAADAGTAAHAVFERLSKGLPEGRVTPDIRPMVDHFKRFLDEVQPEYISLEETIWSDEHKYAGSFDCVFRFTRDIGPFHAGEVVFGDNKTTRSGVHEEVAIQLAAYRNAEYIIRNDGTRVPNVKSTGAAVIHVRPEGAKLVPVNADDNAFDTFLALRSAFDWEKTFKKTAVAKQPIWETADPDAEESGPKRRTARARKTTES
jgi:hypothetical protein